MAQKKNDDIDWSKLGMCMSTDKNKIEQLIIENRKYQSLSTQENGGTVFFDIGNDCCKVYGDSGKDSKIKHCLMESELNMKNYVDTPENEWVNQFCGPQIILEEVVEECRKLKIRLEIRIVGGDSF